jgi:hypothetical protein
MNDRLEFEAIKYGQALADISTRVNWREIDAAEERDAKECGKQLDKTLAELKLETKRQSYDADMVYTRGALGLRAILSNRGEETAVIDEMIKMMDFAFADRREKARAGRRRMAASLRKTQSAARRR